jgi:hypothetical protein
MADPPRYVDEDDEEEEEGEYEGDRRPATAPASSAATVAAAAVPSASRPGYVAVRKRKKRRRSSPPPAAEPIRSGSVHLVLLALIGALIVLSLAGQGLRAQIIASLRGLAPSLGRFASYRFELIALIIAGLVVLYLMPGVEERVLGLLGIKKRRHHRGGDRDREYRGRR